MRRLIIFAASAIALSGCAGTASTTYTTPPAGGVAGTAASASTASSAATATSSGARPAARVSCAKVPLPAPRGAQHLAAPHVTLDPAKTYIVTVRTNCGSFAIELDVKDAPKTTASFEFLVASGFYNGLIFHRIAPGFLIQGGDPSGNGTGGPGYTVIERPPASLQYVRGTVAMAKTDTQPPGASGSQFFIVTTANASVTDGLTPEYALLGRVVSGLNVVVAIGSLATSPTGDDMPITPVVMSRVTVSVH